MANTSVQVDAPSAGQRLRLVVCLSLIAVPHALHLPLWVLALALPIIVWQFVAASRGWPLPGRAVRFTLAGAAFTVVFIGFGRVNGQEAGVSLLLLLLALKLCEIRSQRDAMVFLSLTCFLLATQFLFSQSLAMAIYLVVGLWVLVAAFVDIGSGGSPRTTLGESAGLLVQALPIAVLLFVLFPRLPGPLWGLPADTGARAVSGLSETMSPGSIAQLALSNGVALRARFLDDVPPPSARYWRGPVLWDFDGRSWARNAANERLPAANIAGPGAGRTRVDITLEASRQDWLIALDVPVAANRPSQLTAGATLAVRDDINQRIRYTATSAIGAILDPQLGARMRRRALLLPVEGNERTRALAQRLRSQGLAPARMIERVLQRFRRQPYRYTLSPPGIAGDDTIDAFLFETRAGFCEHYAGAFTFLMRAAGLPARVVTGYQGAEAGTMGDYWVVRNADAHAWSEVWLEGRGWVRVDPTAAVAPERIESGVASALADASSLPYMARAANGAWYQAQMLWDGVNANWDRWFLAYGPQLQQRFLGLLGLGGGWGTPLLVLTAGVVGLLSLVSAGLGWHRRRTRETDAVVQAWREICARLAAIGYPRATHEGPQAYAARIANHRPDLAEALDDLCARYVRLRYAPRLGATAHTSERQAFIRAARRFRPRRSRHAPSLAETR